MMLLLRLHVQINNIKFNIEIVMFLFLSGGIVFVSVGIIVESKNMFNKNMLNKNMLNENMLIKNMFDKKHF